MPLEVNYRCPPAVVGGRRATCWTTTAERVAKTIRSPEGRSDPTRGRRAARRCGAVVVERPGRRAGRPRPSTMVDAWLADGGRPGDIAVLARVNAALLPVQVACAEAGVPCAAPLGHPVLARTGIRTALAYLRIGLDPGRIRREDVRDTIRRPSRGIAPMVVDMIDRQPGHLDRRHPAAGRPADRSRRPQARWPTPTTSTGGRRRRPVDGRGPAGGPGRASGWTAPWTSWTARGPGAGPLHPRRRPRPWSRWRPPPRAGHVRPWLREVPGRAPRRRARVLLSTVHRIKGKEWGHVLVFGASEGMFPHRLSEDVEGERRVFHVALTRAGHQVVVLADGDAPSLFLAELDGVPRTPGRPSRPTRADPTRTPPAARPGPAGGPGRPGRGGPAGLAVERGPQGRRARLRGPERQGTGGHRRGRPGDAGRAGRCRGMGPIRLERGATRSWPCSRGRGTRPRQVP